MTPRQLSLALATLFVAAVHGFRAPPPLRHPRSVKLASTLSDFPQESEEERLRQDELARKRMEEHVRRVTEAKAQADAAGEPSVDRAAWKWEVRQKIWDLLEKQDLAEPPRPVHHRIPNFKGATEAAQRFSTLPEYQEARCVKCNPDTPQKQVRYVTLRDNKLLLVPQPRLRTGFFSKLAASEIPREDMLFACTSQGVKQYGVPLGITADEMPKVDLVVVGSVAVDPATGARLGKGEGFAELEYGMLRMLGAIDENTPVVTTIRDEQLVDGLPTDQLLRHDVPVDIIVTPTTVIRTNTKIPKPTGIYWDLLSPEKLASIRVLQILKARIEEETGQTLPTGPSEVLPPVAERPRGGQQTQRQGQSNMEGNYRGVQQGYGEQSRPQRDYHIVLLNLAYTATSDDVRNLVADTTGMLPTFVSMRKDAEGRPSGLAYVQLSDGGKQAEAVVALTGKELLGRTVKCRAWIVKN